MGGNPPNPLKGEHKRRPINKMLCKNAPFRGLGANTSGKHYTVYLNPTDLAGLYYYPAQSDA
jgi:hypothetical protein